MWNTEKIGLNERPRQDVNRLRRYLKYNKVPSVLIFIGESGSGRKELAYKFVKWANCKQGESCASECVVCQAIDARTYPYLDVFKGSDFLSVEKARDIVGTRKFVPEGVRRFVVVEDLDNASTSAWNALLKMLEQPPDRTHFILVASGKGVPTTIESRGVVFYFGSVDDPVLLDNLQKDPLAKLIWGKMGQIDRDFLLAVAEGSWGRLRGLLSNDAALKLLLAIVHNFTVAKTKTEFFKQVRDYVSLEKGEVVPLESMFRVLLEAARDEKPLVYSRRAVRNLPKLDVPASLSLLGTVSRAYHQRDRVFELMYLTSR